MSPLRIEVADCDHWWTSPLASHTCIQPANHDGPHECFCGAQYGGPR